MPSVAIAAVIDVSTPNRTISSFINHVYIYSGSSNKTPTLSFCVDRARAIESFVAEKYWTIEVSTGKDGQKDPFELEWTVPFDVSVPVDRGRSNGANFIPNSTFDEKLAREVRSLSSSPGVQAVITKIEEEEIERSPPFGLNTVALLSAGSKALGLSPKQMMNVAESLYSSGFLSYPRTESTKYDPTGFDVREILEDHRSHPEWGKTAGFLLATKYKRTRRPPQRGVDAGDHPPITCLKSATREEIGGGQSWRVYDFVTRSFLGSLSDSLVYTQRTATLQLRDKESCFMGPEFKLSQTSVSSLGFAGACRWVLNDIGAQRKGVDGPPLVEGASFSIGRVELKERKTRPPTFLQEHELIDLMDQNRIGTDASMAVHVSNILDRGYVTLVDETGEPLRPPPRPGQKKLPRQKGRYLVPTSLGVALIDLFADSGSDYSPVRLAEPAIRAQMEQQVGEIADGQREKDECLEQNLSWFEKRYLSFESLLTKRRNTFAATLQPVRQSLRYWAQLGAFEDSIKSKQTATVKRNRKTSSMGRASKTSPSRSMRRAGMGKVSRPDKGKTRGSASRNQHATRR